MDQKPRQIAARILFEWDAGEGYAEILLKRHLTSARLSPPDRRLVQEMVYGVIRNAALLDAWIDIAARQPPGKSRSRSLLRLGFYQLGLMDRIPEHAAVNETVQTARRCGLHTQSGFINALMRRFIREKTTFMEQWEDWKRTLPAIAYSHPAWLVEKWEEQWDTAAATTLCQWNQGAPSIMARWNPIQGSVESLQDQWNQEGIAFKKCLHDWSAPHRLFELKSPKGSPADSESFQQGKYYIQDPSTLLAVHLLDPQPTESILDACAAPGGKTAALSSLMQNQGTLHATDPDPVRLKRLQSNLHRLGIQNVRSGENLTQLGQASKAPSYDGILVDAPCSNTGVMRRRLDVRWRLSTSEIQTCCEQQSALLESTAPWVRPGGRMVYSTCSLEPEENQEQIDTFLREHSNWSLATARQLTPLQDGVDGAYAALLHRTQ